MVQFTLNRGVHVREHVYGNALIHRARNQALAQMRPEATHVFFVDDDMLPPPDALVRLLNVRKPVVSALCTTRSYADLRIAAKVYDPDTDGFGALSRLNLSRVVCGPFAVGTAFLLLDRGTVDRLIEYYLGAQDWVDERLRELSRLHVRVEYRERERLRKEALRRELFERQQILRIFDYPVNEGEMQLGEDICLGRKLLNLGIEVAIDATTQVGHLGEYPYTISDVMQREDEALTV
jgi:glycosyltransferase involved in cell wall biosynthesis